MAPESGGSRPPCTPEPSELAVQTLDPTPSGRLNRENSEREAQIIDERAIHELAR